MSLRKQIFMWGSKYRNPSLWQHYSDLKDSEKWDYEKLRRLQESRLFRLLEHAAVTTTYFRNVFKELGWKQGDPVSRELYSKLPVTTKDMLIAQNEDFHSELESEKLFLCETSGTSGQVLTFRRNESWDSFNRASIFRGYSWFDVHPWDYNLYFWGYNFKGAKKIRLRIFDLLVNRYRMFGYSEDTIRQLVNKIRKAVFIEGYSSMIYELACAAENRRLDTSRLKLVKGTSEKIYPHYIQKTKEVFGKGMISEYGATETGIIAFECPYGSMHINMEGVFVETDSDNEILVTNLHSLSFPVIRYRLGDSVVIPSNQEHCKCGMAHPIIREITGRIGKKIYGRSKTYPSFTFYYIFKNLFFEKNMKVNFQAHQAQKGEITFWIKESLTDSEKELIAAESYKYFTDDIDISFQQHSDFRLQEGKLRDFVSHIDN